LKVNYLGRALSNNFQKPKSTLCGRPLGVFSTKKMFPKLAIKQIFVNQKNVFWNIRLPCRAAENFANIKRYKFYKITKNCKFWKTKKIFVIFSDQPKLSTKAGIRTLGRLERLGPNLYNMHNEKNKEKKRKFFKMKSESTLNVSNGMYF